jgi:hypothetical protein
MKVALVGWLLVAIVFLVSACQPGEPTTGSLRYQHDDKHNVGCWNWGSMYGIYCLPDSQYQVTK